MSYYFFINYEIQDSNIINKISFYCPNIITNKYRNIFFIPKFNSYTNSLLYKAPILYNKLHPFDIDIFNMSQREFLNACNKLLPNSKHKWLIGMIFKIY